MDDKRNRITNVVNYLESLGIQVNVGKNKARGNQGFFKTIGESFRIDVAKKLSEEETLRVLIHEFAHYVHYKYDKKLKSLDFIIETDSEELIEELIEITVSTISKNSVAPLFEAKEKLKTDIKNLQKSNKINSYWELQFLKRALNRINSKISRLNRYYNTPTELFARSIEIYLTDRNLFSKKAPSLLKCYDKVFLENKVPLLSELNKNLF